MKHLFKKLKGVLVATMAVTALCAMSSFAFAGDCTSASISTVVAQQNADGGWKKVYATTSGDWAKSTIDNGGTYTEIRRLAKEYMSTNNATYKDACLKGINFLLKMQLDNGGWPQIYGTTSDKYHMCITYNDNAMINVMYLLDDVSKKSGDFSWVDSTLASQCASAVTKGVDCVLKTQVSINGNLTVWGQQHDQVTLKPAGARVYEVPSLCSAESVGIVKFLKTRTQTTAIKTSINAALDWFYKSQLTGIKTQRVYDSSGTLIDVVVVKDASASPLWGRFYSLEVNKPIFVGRDGVIKYNLSEIDQERRTGYSWYNNSASALGIPLPTASPSPSPSTSPSPSPSPSPSTSPSPSPSPSPSTSPSPSPSTSPSPSPSTGAGKVTLTANGNTISATVEVSAAAQSINLKGYTVKQKFTAEGVTSSLVTYVDSASAQLNVSPWYTALNGVQATVTSLGSNQYELTVTFSSDLIIATGQGTATANLRICQSNWANFSNVALQ